MSDKRFEVTDKKKVALLNKFFARRYPEVEQVPEKIYLYPSFRRGFELLNIRYLLPDNSAISYNLPAGQFEIFQTKIREGRWDWMVRPNGIKELQEYKCGPHQQHSSANNKFVTNNHLMNVNLNFYTLPQGAWETEDPSIAYFDGMYTVDITNIDNAFMALSNVVAGTMRRVHANLTLIGNDLNIIKDHDLYFGFAIDKATFSVQPSLTKIMPHLPDGGQIELELKPMVAADWNFLTPMGQQSIEHVQEAFNELNTAIEAFLAGANTHPACLNYAENQIITTFGMFISAGHLVYKYNLEHNRDTIEKIANDILTRIGELPGINGLDINSWRVWNYDDIENPKAVLEVNIEEEIYNHYIDSFIEVLYQHLMQLNSPLIRPYSRIEKVAEENRHDHRIGQVRIEKQ